MLALMTDFKCIASRRLDANYDGLAARSRPSPARYRPLRAA